MALPQPSESEVQSILSVLCYAKVTDPEHFQAVLDFYTATVCQDPHPGHAVQISPPVLRSHQAVVEACAGLRATLSTPKSEVERQLFQDGTEEAERHRSLRTITKLALMIDCDSRSNFSVNFKRQTDEAFPTRWRDTDTFVDFFHSAFSTNETSPLRTSDIGNHLKAWKLRKRCSIRITPTNDLAQHLVYNKGSRSLSVFHQVAYLKAHLQHVSHLDISATAAESIPWYVPSLLGFNHSAPLLQSLTSLMLTRRRVGLSHHSYCWKPSTQFTTFSSLSRRTRNPDDWPGGL